jgi:transcriptional regulator with XRE-family HTH domain
MNSAASTAARFRTARERAGLSIAETAARAGISEPCVWDLESYDDELMTVYSPGDLQRFVAIFAVYPRDLVGTEDRDDPVSIDELASAICEHCRALGLTINEFSDAAGWDVSKVMDAPQLLLSDISIDGIRDICHELGIDWQRLISGLSAETGKGDLHR